MEELKDVGATRARAGEGGCSPASPLCHPREAGEGDEPVPCSESPGVGNRDQGCGTGSALRQGIKPSQRWRLHLAASAAASDLLSPNSSCPTTDLGGGELGWCLHSIPLPDKQGESRHSLKLQGFLQNSMLEIKNWDREGINLKKI